MPANSTRPEPGAVPATAPSPAANALPTPIQEATRWFSLQDGARAKQFTASLKTTARWTKQFLHRAK